MRIVRRDCDFVRPLGIRFGLLTGFLATDFLQLLFWVDGRLCVPGSAAVFLDEGEGEKGRANPPEEGGCCGLRRQGTARLCERAQGYTLAMQNEFTAVIERDGEWFVGWSPEIPGANGQGRTLEECRANLAAAIRLILEDRREDGLRGVPPDAIRETVTVQ